jgi:hypothetical protein
MKYKVTLASFAICNPAIARTLPAIPGTNYQVFLDTASGLGRDIWFGYLQMRQDQKGKKLDEDDPYRIRVPEDGKPENEIHKFREAIDLFMRFLAGDGRDNCPAVEAIEIAV